MIPDNFTGTVLTVISSHDHTLKSAFKLIIKGLAPIMQLRTCKMKITLIQGKSPYGEIVFPYQKGHALKQRICSQWEQMLPLKRSP